MRLGTLGAVRTLKLTCIGVSNNRSTLPTLTRAAERNMSRKLVLSPECT
uniref:Uncharacterized protein n=1 Tax=Anopheles atroparvus TaxID=41427 RepID=A0AAG5DM57_ANOAO